MSETSYVLVVDDDAAIRQLVTDLLSFDLQHRIVAVEDGAMALAQIARSKPDLILCDLMMPRIDGYEVCRRVKLNPETRKIPFIVITAGYNVRDVLPLGSDGIVTKPFDTDFLVGLVRAWLAKRRPGTDGSATYPTGDTSQGLKTSVEILLVETSTEDAHRLASAFKAAQPEVSVELTAHVVDSGQAAMNWLRSRQGDQVDLILMDTKVAGVDPETLLRGIKNDPDLRTVPVMMVTNAPAEAELLASYVDGATQYLTKPLDPLEFREKLEDLPVYWAKIRRGHHELI